MQKQVAKTSTDDGKLFAKLIDNTERRRLIFLAVSVVFGLISAVYCVLYAIRGDMYLTIGTLVFTIVSFINLAILSWDPKKLTASYFIFSANLLMLMNYILFCDDTQTGLMWMFLLPACGCTLLGLRFGSLLTGLMELELVYLMWFPNGLFKAENPDFCRRYPFIFLAFFLVGFFLEYIRAKTYEELEKLQEKFKEMSIRDALTGAYNRHWINNELPQKMKEFCGVRSLGVMIMDIDFFKNINDTYGHLFGDTVLKTLSDMLKDILIEGGSVCRWGGEEFAILLDDADKETVLAKAEGLRSSVEDMKLEFEGRPVKVTISIGCVAMIPTMDMRPGFLIDCADKALYAAKNSGRNNVQYHEEPWRYRGLDA